MSPTAASDDLRSKLDAIPASPQLRFVPIRHHSPACAHHLKRLIESEQPELVLIEGPADATPLLRYLTEPDAQAPLALYFFHCQKTTDWLNTDVDVQRQRGFYPLADFSPEWVAVRSATELSAEVRLIDLPYAARPMPQDSDAEGQEPTLLDDRDLADADPTTRMVELAGCRDFNEWWDRYFESGGLELDPNDYFRQVLSWCLLLRQTGQHNDANNQAREAYMAAHVRDAVATGKRVMVVTGGFHTEAIAQQYKESTDDTKLSESDGEQGIYLVPYTLGRLDAANGYAAGIANSGYYQEVWQQLSAGEQSPHSAAARKITTRIGQDLQARGELVCLPDSIEAVLMSHRLGALRGVTPGRAELFDAMQATFVKSTHDVGAEAKLLDLVDLDRKGQLPKRYPAAPLVEDFRNQCKYFKLPLGPIDGQEKRLDIYRSERHRQISRLLHRITFLTVPYSELVAGPDFAAGEQLQRVREIWQLQWSPDTEAMLTERMAYGGQLTEASLNFLLEKLSQDPRQSPRLLVEALQMGLHGVLDRVLSGVEQWLQQEGQFPALVDGLRLLVLAYSAQSALAAQQLPALAKILGDCFERACLRLSWLGQTDDETALAYMAALGDLNALARRPLDTTQFGWADVPLFLRSVESLYQSAAPPAVRGRAAAILASRQVWPTERTQQALQDVLAQAHLEPDYLGAFMLGFLPLAKATLIQSPDLLEGIDQLIGDWPEGVFLSALPDLRLAFTALKPRETIALSRSLGMAIEPTKPRRSATSAWTPSELDQLQQLAEDTQSALKRWGFES